MTPPAGGDPAPSRPTPTERWMGDHAMSALLARNWWALAIRGVLAVLFGLLALFLPGATMISLALVFGAYLIADGVFAVIAAVRAAQAHERWGLLAAEGVFTLLVGVLAILFPVSAVFAFVLVTAAWALVSGVMLIAAAFRLTRRHGRWWMALSGAVSVLFGVALVVAPLIGAIVLTWWVAIYALFFGVMLLFLAFRLRRERDAAPG
ncbi:MAG: HdeD family acid-resistance protein [Alphaproteobacteria bacterium]|nr:HdeD family acid-resistance protein [Alphaproteobacteria bacterium]